MKNSNRLCVLSKIFLPLRIISVITLVPIFTSFHISWQYATIIFSFFFPIFIASFVVETICNPDKLKEKVFRLGIKYLHILPFEFLGIAVFALASFFPQSPEAHEIEVKVVMIVIGIGVFFELFHYVMPDIEKLQLDVKKILAIIAMTVLMVFEGISILMLLIFLNP